MWRPSKRFSAVNKNKSARRCEQTAAIIETRNWYQCRGYEILDVKPHCVSVRAASGIPRRVTPEGLIITETPVRERFGNF